MKIAINGTNHSNCFERIEWGGDVKGSARHLQVTMFQKSCECGDTVELYNEIGKRLFIGKVFRVERKSEEDMMVFKAFDNAIYLNKNSFVKNFFQLTPSEISKQILGEIGLESGTFPSDSVKCTFPAIDRTGYEIILTAYTIQNGKDGIIYSVISEDNKISVVEQGTLIGGYVLDSSKNMRNGSYSATIENMINKVVIYKTEQEKIQLLTPRQKAEDIEKYGVFQSVQQMTWENEALIDVQKILKGIEERGQVTVDGMNDLVSGYSVAVSVSNVTKLTGTFLIEADYHVWEHNDYYCELELNFENIMNTIDIDKYEKKKKKQNDEQYKDTGSQFDSKKEG